MTTQKLLIIRHGALGDLVQSTGPFKAIRKHHPEAHITLLTTPHFANFMDGCPWIDDIWQDFRPRWFQLIDWLSLRRKLRDGCFARVYDLQTSFRSSLYIHAFSNKMPPEWSGVAPGASHLHKNPQRNLMHTLDRQADQLMMLGIDDVPDPDLSWVIAKTEKFELVRPFALVVPGGAVHRPAKRWPADYYIELCRRLFSEFIQPVLIGGPDEVALNAGITAQCPGVRDLAGQTTIEEVVVLARMAELSIGNDTGPMHIAAASGCPVIVLFSKESDPDLCAPRGRNVTIIRESILSELSVDNVWHKISL